MDDEIDLRVYVRILLKDWVLIVGCVLAGALVAGGISFKMPRVYQTSALLTTSAATPNIAALTKSDAMLQAMIAKLGSSLPADLAQPAALRSLLAASQAANTTGVQLTVTDGTPGQAALIANAWAEAVVQEVQRSYGSSHVFTLQAQLNAQLALLSDVSASRYTLQWVSEEAQALRDQLARQAADRPASMEAEAVLLSLNLQASTGPSVQVSAQQGQQSYPGPNQFSGSSQPSGTSLQSFTGVSLQSFAGPDIQFQVSSSPTRTVGEQLQAADNLLQTLNSRRQVLQARTEALQADILETQQRQVSEQTTFTTPFTVQVYQSAAVPTTPIAPTTTRNLLLGMAIGLAGGVGLAFGWDWWKQEGANRAEGSL
jgi:capsular polysaccharide biosynthesis protein